MEPWSHDFTDQLHPPPAVWSWATGLILVNASSLYQKKKKMEIIVTKVDVRIKKKKKNSLYKVSAHHK